MHNMNGTMKTTLNQVLNFVQNNAYNDFSIFLNSSTQLSELTVHTLQMTGTYWKPIIIER